MSETEDSREARAAAIARARRNVRPLAHDTAHSPKRQEQTATVSF